jgi:hypothetical protein
MSRCTAYVRFRGKANIFLAIATEQTTVRENGGVILPTPVRNSNGF